MKKKALLFTFLGVMIAIAAAIAIIWNKPHETVDDQTGQKISAAALADAFGQNEQNANAAYLNKVIEVTGRIAETSKNQDGKGVVVLEASDPLSGVQCTMKDDGNYEVGKPITIKGFCNGYTTVVLLSDCVVVR